jgi:predicted acyl esterase
MRHVRTLITAIALALAVAGCTSGDSASQDTVPDYQEASFDTNGSVEQVAVNGGEPGDDLALVDESGEVVDTGTVDDLGGLLFRTVAPGTGYVVRQDGEGPVEASGPLAVAAVDDDPDPSLYEQVLEPGFGYLETRDGTTLSINVTLPGPVEDGPYPTLVEYSGYDPSNPDEPEPSTLIGNALGYATVGVNVRGTGCSGGSFDFFEALQLLDGYDVIETVAAQDWVKGHRVGMVGLSYPGISQLFVARTQPPSLASIAPISVLDDSYRSTMYPGGILNTGFALSWIENVGANAVPGGQGWDQERIDAGDDECAANTLLRGQNPDFLDAIDLGIYYTNEDDFLHYGPDYWSTLAPGVFADEIDVPVFLAGAWQDEQTGGRFPTMLDRFSSSPDFNATLYNGTHGDGFGPYILPRLVEFLDLYVAEEVPQVHEALYAVAPAAMSGIYGVDVELPAIRFTDAASYDEALAAFQAEPSIRVLFENGAGAEPGAPVPVFEASFDSWPPPDTEPTTWYLDADGQLSSGEPDADDGSAEGADQFVYDPAGGEITFHNAAESIFTALPAYDWLSPEEGKEAAYVSEPFAADTVMLGHGSADLWVQSSAPDTDLEVVLTEVRPDGQERYVTAGWLRASQRALDDEASTELQPVHTHAWEDAADLPEGEWDLARVELFPFGHVFREGTKLRLSVGSPGGNRPVWSFVIQQPDDEVTNRVAHSTDFASRLVLPVVPGVEVTGGLAPCPSLRGQPCRSFLEYANTPSPD